jgi:opacity protein-like surface antigen
MKKLLLIFIFSFNLHAQDIQDTFESIFLKVENNFYVKAAGGLNFLNAKTDFGGYKYNFKNGFLLSGSLGVYCPYGLRLEAELAFRNNGASKVTEDFYDKASYKASGYGRTHSYMINLLWDLPELKICYDLQPYVGVGVGYDTSKIRFNVPIRTMCFSMNKTCQDVAWQIIGGLNYRLFSNTDILFEYIYHDNSFSKVASQSVAIGLTYSFGSGSILNGWIK